MADHVLLVTQLDLPCLRNVVRLMMSFAEMPGVLDKVKIVVNRLGLDAGQISLKKAQDTIGREIFWKLPNDYRTMVEVRNNGVPLIEQAPKAKITQGMIGLADALTGVEQAPVADGGSKSSLAKMLSRWASRGSAAANAQQQPHVGS
jgi:pilus assembly protein CpaE